MGKLTLKKALETDRLSGGFPDFTFAEADSVPHWIARTNMVFSLVCVVVLGIAIYLNI